MAAYDFHVARSVSIGVSAGYNWMVPFGHAVGSRTDYSGAMVGVSAGLLFGKGRLGATSSRHFVTRRNQLYALSV